LPANQRKTSFHRRLLKKTPMLHRAREKPREISFSATTAYSVNWRRDDEETNRGGEVTRAVGLPVNA
jgi:hypothetical protein